MPFVQTQFYVNPEIFSLLKTGDLKRWGGVVRDSAGQIVTHLDEYDLGIKDAVKQVGVATIEVIRSNKTKTAIIVGVLAGASVAGGVIAYKTSVKKIAEHEEVIDKLQMSMEDYFRAISKGELNDNVMDCLLEAVEEAKRSSICKGKSGRLLSEYLKIFSDSIEDYTRELCKANGLQFNAIKTSDRDMPSKRIDAIRDYLLLQKTIVDRAA